MAIKAGLVGVNPKGVDRNGMPIASGGNSVDEAQLTANGKKFFFAYDQTSEKYGYKLDGAGDFIPFESAGGGPGWVKPAEMTTEGLTPNNCTIEEGGYFIDDNNIVYVDMVVHTTGSNASISGMPHANTSYNITVPRADGASVDGCKDNYAAAYFTTLNVSTHVMSGSMNNGAYYHFFTQYPLKTS